jgi:hypothetical protein
MRTFQLTFTLTIFVNLGLFLSVWAEKRENFQAGYIVIRQDTIKGFVQVGDHSSHIKQCVFKETPTAPERIYSPDDLVAYGVTGKSFFISADIQVDQPMGSRIFMECLVKGDFSLFVYRNRFFIGSVAGLQELSEVKEEIRKNAKTFVVRRPFYKSILQQQMGACAAIHETLVDTQLTRKSLVALFVKYASCVGDEATVFESADSQENNVRYGFAVGILSARLDMNSQRNIRYLFAEQASDSRSFTITPSFLIELGISDRFDLCTGINYYFTSNELRGESFGGNLTYHFLLEGSRIEVPILIKYNLSRGNVKWNLKGGTGFNGLINFKDRLTTSTTSSGLVLNEYNNDLKKNSITLNFMGGVGAEFLVNDRSFLIEGFYSRSGSLVSSSTHAHLDGFKFSIGMFL